VDGALRKAVHPDPSKRYDTLSGVPLRPVEAQPRLRQRHRPAPHGAQPGGLLKGLSLLLLLGNLVLLYLLAR
jgi:hypothetical protein